MQSARVVIGLLLFLSVIAVLPARAAITPTFEPSQFIYWGSGQVIQVGNNGPIPNVADWDNDGVKDLMVGVYQAGNIYYYHNTGTNANPVFPTRELVMANGVAISVSFG